jgi:hypothetical protein
MRILDGTFLKITTTVARIQNENTGTLIDVPSLITLSADQRQIGQVALRKTT